MHIVCIKSSRERVLMWIYVFTYHFSVIVYIERLYYVIFYYMLVTFGLPIPLQFCMISTLYTKFPCVYDTIFLVFFHCFDHIQYVVGVLYTFSGL